MNVAKWIAVNQRGGMRVTQGKPQLAPNEIAMHVTFSIPDALFVRPAIEATLTVEADAPTLITADTLTVLQSAIERDTGLSVALSIVSADERVLATESEEAQG